MKMNLSKKAGQSKWAYFLTSNTDNFISDHPEISDLLNGPETLAADPEMLDQAFPFWRKEKTKDFSEPI
jgi:hypothetical protein